MKIAYIVNTYPRPSHSFIRREIRALEAMGHEVVRFAMRADPSPLIDPQDRAEAALTHRVLTQPKGRLLGDIVRQMGRPRAFGAALAQAWGMGRLGAGGAVAGTGGRVRHLIYLAEACHLAEQVRAQGVMHLHAHFGTNSTTVTMLTAMLTGLPYSFTTHGPEEFDAPRILGLGPKVARAAFAVAISHFGRSQLMRWCDFADWPKIEVIRCGIEADKFPTPLPLPAGRGRLVCIGRLSEQKGQMLLLQALAQALPEAPDLHLTLVGDGELRAALVAEIARLNLGPHVTLTGWLDEAGVRDALGTAHALVLPSFAEGLPMVVMEAMAAGRPVLATAIAGMPELVDGETGWLIPAGDVMGLAQALGDLTRTPHDILARMGAAGRARVLARHDSQSEAAKLATLFQRPRVQSLGAGPARTASDTTA